MFSHEQKVAFERFLYHVFRFFFLFILCLLAFRFFVFSTGVVNGPSMLPNFKDDQTFFVNRFIYLIHPPERTDVVQIIDPKEKKLIIKRIIGLPGETVAIKRGKVFISSPNQPEYELNETKYLGFTPPFTDIPSWSQIRTFTLGPNEYFVLGDNRWISVDSRYYGALPRSHVVGKIK